MNNFNEIAKFYASYEAELLSTPANQWVIDPFAWEDFIQLTPIERWLWEDIRRVGAVFYPQYPVGRYFVDFANPAARLAIECDGAAFHQDKEKDAARDAEIEAMGWNIYRLTGSDCFSDDDEESGYVARGRRFLEAACNVYQIRPVYTPPLTGEMARQARLKASGLPIRQGAH